MAYQDDRLDAMCANPLAQQAAYAQGYAQGRADERADAIAWLKRQHPFGDQRALEAVAEAMKNGDHKGAAGGQRVLTIDEWCTNRDQVPENLTCPCDNHPPEKCETCCGACSCHYTRTWENL